MSGSRSLASDAMSGISDNMTETTYLNGANRPSAPRSIMSIDSSAGSQVTGGGGGRLRVYVQIPSGQRLLLAVPADSTVGDLQFAALRRASRFGLQTTLADSLIRTTGPMSAVLFGEDRLEDFIAETEGNTFDLELAVDVATPAPTETTATAVESRPQSPPQPPGPRITNMSTSLKLGGDNSRIFVRYISPWDAVSNQKLSRIPADDAYFERNTTLATLYETAIARLNQFAQSRGSCVTPTKPKMWTSECCLDAKDNQLTLYELGLRGSRHEPLDIFLQWVGDEERTSTRQVSEYLSPQSVWGFNTTYRGFCTFTTCLLIFFREMEKMERMVSTDAKKVSLERIYHAILEVTNFPPVLAAMEILRGADFEGEPDLDALLLLADVFNALCHEMVPDWVCPSSENKLEGSRQVFAWILNLCTTAPKEELPKYLHKVQIVWDTASPDRHPGTLVDLEHHEVVEVANPTAAATPGSNPAASGSTPPVDKLVVGLEKQAEGLARRLVLLKAHSPTHISRYGYYFHPATTWGEFVQRNALTRPSPADFDALLQEANFDGAFRMVDPLRMGACRSVDLPVITLSAKGYVSKYDQMDIGCGERYFYQWNVIQKKISLQGTDPGQDISQKLESIIQERKKAGTWEVDAWAEWTEQSNHGDPDESIVVCVDKSDSMAEAMLSGWVSGRDDGGTSHMRIAEVKEFFLQFITRLSSYSLNTSVGLVTFSSRWNVVTDAPLAMLQQGFTERLEDVSPGGSTAVFNAISRAKDMLVEQKQKHPRSKCRIILLTDGDDNSSNVDKASLCHELYDNEIVLDSIVVGTGAQYTGDLFKLSRASGGYAFKPPTQAVFFQIFLLETFIDIRTRPDAARTRVTSWNSFAPKDPDMEDPFSFPPCRPHPNQSDYFIALSDAPRFLRMLQAANSRASTATSTATSTTASGHPPAHTPSHSTRSDARSNATGTTLTGTRGGASVVSSTAASRARILMGEVQAMIEHAHEFTDVYVSQANMGFWKVVMQGPQGTGSPYERGTFLLYVDIGEDFPRVSPQVRFITPILHPNVSKHGRVCHPIFDREWTSRKRVYEVLLEVFALMMDLESRDAIDPIATLQFYTDPVAGRQMVSDYIQRFATRTRAEHRADIIDDDVSTVASTAENSGSSSDDDSDGGSTVSGGTARPKRHRKSRPGLAAKRRNVGGASGSRNAAAATTATTSSGSRPLRNPFVDEWLPARVSERHPSVITRHGTGTGNGNGSAASNAAAVAAASLQSPSQGQRPSHISTRNMPTRTTTSGNNGNDADGPTVRLRLQPYQATAPPPTQPAVPHRLPPLMVMDGGAQHPQQQRQGLRSVHTGQVLGPSVASLPLTAENLRAATSNAAATNAPTAGLSRGRRASFFAMMRRAGGSTTGGSSAGGRNGPSRP